MAPIFSGSVANWQRCCSTATLSNSVGKPDIWQSKTALFGATLSAMAAPPSRAWTRNPATLSPSWRSSTSHGAERLRRGRHAHEQFRAEADQAHPVRGDGSGSGGGTEDADPESQRTPKDFRNPTIKTERRLTRDSTYVAEFVNTPIRLEDVAIARLRSRRRRCAARHPVHVMGAEIPRRRRERSASDWGQV